MILLKWLGTLLLFSSNQIKLSIWQITKIQKNDNWLLLTQTIANRNCWHHKRKLFFHKGQYWKYFAHSSNSLTYFQFLTFIILYKILVRHMPVGFICSCNIHCYIQCSNLVDYKFSYKMSWVKITHVYACTSTYLHGKNIPAHEFLYEIKCIHNV